ncbi:MAG: type II toxin-antitoxin system RelE/ParE family toxin [Bacteroidia bacterium]|jgi:plasmid stabilization system protein ParE|nr:type II toxin-antitoxin system RelE/ParE family toxin [Bacteroidia bacterium]
MPSEKKIRKVVLLQAAESEYLAYAAYYENQQSGLGERFVGEFTAQLAYLQQYPFAFQYKWRRYRVALMSRFPCLLVYRVHKSSIIVYAVMHNRQNPKRLRKLK